MLRIPDVDDRIEIMNMLISQDSSHASVWYEIFEYRRSNGGFTPIDPECHMVGLTSDPYILGEDVTVEDNGDITVYGKTWFYPDYMITSALERLIVGDNVRLVMFNDKLKGERFQAHHNVEKHNEG